jgi:transposase-like protein
MKRHLVDDSNTQSSMLCNAIKDKVNAQKTYTTASFALMMVLHMTHQEIKNVSASDSRSNVISL